MKEERLYLDQVAVASALILLSGSSASLNRLWGLRLSDGTVDENYVERKVACDWRHIPGCARLFSEFRLRVKGQPPSLFLLLFIFSLAAGTPATAFHIEAWLFSRE